MPPRPDSIAYLTTEERPIDIAGLMRLYESADWARGRDSGGVQASLAASIAVGAWEGERLVGFTRALSDGRYRAYVEDVVIDPEYRQYGIGTKMVARLLAALPNVRVVSLFCEPERVAFYERNGFRASPKQVMVHRSREQPAG